MKTKSKKSLERSFIATIGQFTFCCHDAIEEIQNTANLPLFCYERLAAANLCTLHINRICNLFEHILTQDDPQKQKIQSFYPENILSGIAKTLTDTVADHISLKINCNPDAICNFPVAVNQTEFEFAFLNLLYCSIRSGDDSPHKTTRISLSAKELKDHIQFHIKDNGNLLNPLIANSLGVEHISIPQFASPRDSLISFSFDVVSQIISGMKGTFSYKPLKSGNRYHITLPKSPKNLPDIANSPAIYIPNIQFYQKIFGDIIEESQIHQFDLGEDLL